MSQDRRITKSCENLLSCLGVMAAFRGREHVVHPVLEIPTLNLGKVQDAHKGLACCVGAMPSRASRYLLVHSPQHKWCKVNGLSTLCHMQARLDESHRPINRRSSAASLPRPRQTHPAFPAAPSGPPPSSPWSRPAAAPRRWSAAAWRACTRRPPPRPSTASAP